MQIAILLVVVIIFYILYYKYFDGKSAPFVLTEPEIVNRVVKFADVGKDDVFFDLGSGDGRFVIAAAMRGAKAYGIELSRIKVWYARFWIWLLRLGDKATIIHGDIFDADLSEATVVNCYLLQETNNKLENKLVRELKVGARVVTVAFEFNNLKEEKRDLKGVIYGPLHLYIV